MTKAHRNPRGLQNPISQNTTTTFCRSTYSFRGDKSPSWPQGLPLQRYRHFFGQKDGRLHWRVEGWKRIQTISVRRAQCCPIRVSVVASKQASRGFHTLGGRAIDGAKPPCSSSSSEMFCLPSSYVQRVNSNILRSSGSPTSSSSTDLSE